MNSHTSFSSLLTRIPVDLLNLQVLKSKMSLLSVTPAEYVLPERRELITDYL